MSVAGLKYQGAWVMQGPPAETKIIGLNPGSISAGLEGLYKPIRFNKMRFNKIYYSKL